MATKNYEAESDLLVTPVSSTDITLTSLGLLRDSTDPTQPVETAARLVTNVDVAERAKKTLGSSKSANELLEQVSAAPVAGSNIVAITGSSSDPDEAAAIANAFGEAIVEERTEQMHDQINKTLPNLEAQLKAAPDQSVGRNRSAR